MLKIIKFASFSKEILAWLNISLFSGKWDRWMVRRISRVQMPGAKNDNRNAVYYRKKNRKPRPHDPLFPLWGRAAPYRSMFVKQTRADAALLYKGVSRALLIRRGKLTWEIHARNSLG